MALLLPDWPVPVGYQNVLELNCEAKKDKKIKVNTDFLGNIGLKQLPFATTWVRQCERKLC